MTNINYQIPQEIVKAVPLKFATSGFPMETKTIFLSPYQESNFLDFPSDWHDTLNASFDKIFNSFNTKYNISIMSYDGKEISSHSQQMVGYNFRSYLAGLLRAAKTIALFILDGVNITKYIICQA